MPKLSAGLLLYRATDAGVELLIDRPVLGTQRRWRMVDSEG
jgi:predicted NUDIX family NTP pyrophosphohydrolase